MISFRERIAQPDPILFDGALGTLLYQQGIFVNRAFEEVCLSSPSQLQSIHRSYILAGAEVIETNTFGANTTVLGQYGLETRLAEINTRAVEIAKHAAEGHDVYVAGSIGQVYGDNLQGLNLQETYQDQVDSLVTAGVDLICLETFSNIKVLQLMVKLVRSQYDIPLIAMASLNKYGSLQDGTPGRLACEMLNGLDVDMVGFNCSIGPQNMTTFLLDHLKLLSKPVCVMPNAGETHQVAGRVINLFTEEYFAKYVKRFSDMGIKGIGGCCGIHPNHIKKARETLKGGRGAHSHTLSSDPKKVEIDKTPLPPCSKFHSDILHGRFVLSVEMTTPRGMSSETTLSTITTLANQGVKYINIPDGPRATSRMSALLFTLEVARKTSIEPILHYCLRDKNILAILGELLAAHEQGLRNLLIITGDPPKVGNFPSCTGVFDLDSVELLTLCDQFNRGYDFAGNEIVNFGGNYCIGSGFNHTAYNADKEIDRMKKKMDAGALFMVSQPVFSVRQFEDFMQSAHQKIPRLCPVLSGVWPLASLRNALFLKENVPGVHIEESVIARLSAYEDAKDQRKVGQEIAKEICEKIIPMVKGISLAAPMNKYEVISPIIDFIQCHTPQNLLNPPTQPARAKKPPSQIITARTITERVIP